MTPPTFLLSICIPAYKNISYLQRLLESVKIQTFRDFEVVITDDSPDMSVASLVDQYRDSFAISYKKNVPALGSPANWNACIRLARGGWIKMMHDDDWFVDGESLGKFAAATKLPDVHFIFSGFNKVDIEHDQREACTLTDREAALLHKNAYNILSRNVIGHPSTTLVKNTHTEWYDERVKWVVDIEYYSRLLTRYPSFHAIREPLINIGIGGEQITKQVFRNPAVEVPENLYLLNKLGVKILRSVLVYDYFWRFIRNLGIRHLQMVDKYRGDQAIAPVLKVMVRQQGLIPAGLLRNGFISKPVMFLSYLYCRLTNKLVL